jgi:hypothetical protein
MNPQPSDPFPPPSTAADECSGNAATDFEEKDGILFYRGTRLFEELEFPLEAEADAADYTWARQDPQVQREHAGLVILVRGRKVWGAGKTPRAAWEQARQAADCPPLDELLFVVVPGPAPSDSARNS